jgi:L-aspartate oxidase
MCTTALMITAAALARQESRGGHFRDDFPASDPDQALRSRLTLREARLIASGL